jgi:hypothetical protein
VKETDEFIKDIKVWMEISDDSDNKSIISIDNITTRKTCWTKYQEGTNYVLVTLLMMHKNNVS